VDIIAFEIPAAVPLPAPKEKYRLAAWDSVGVHILLKGSVRDLHAGHIAHPLQPGPPATPKDGSEIASPLQTGHRDGALSRSRFLNTNPHPRHSAGT
jgi:hypothetical protein